MNQVNSPLALLSKLNVVRIAEFVGVFTECCFDGWPRGRLLRNVKSTLRIHTEIQNDST